MVPQEADEEAELLSLNLGDGVSQAQGKTQVCMWSPPVCVFSLRVSAPSFHSSQLAESALVHQGPNFRSHPPVAAIPIRSRLDVDGKELAT